MNTLRESDAVFPISVEAPLQWSTAIELIAAPQPPRANSSLVTVTITVAEGQAGVGWRTSKSIAEEIFVDAAPHPRRIRLTLWEPNECEAIFVRNSARSPLRAVLHALRWSDLDDASGDAAWRSWLEQPYSGAFCDQPFENTFAQTLWRLGARAEIASNWRFRRLRRLVDLAWRHCPGYRDWWTQNGWRPSDLRRLEDANEIPVITKQQIRADIRAFSLNRRRSHEFTTAGSTGEPLPFRFTSTLHSAHTSLIGAACSYGLPGLAPPRHKFLNLCRSVPGLSVTGSGGSLLIGLATLRERDLLLRLLEIYRPTTLFGWPTLAADLAATLEGRYRFRLAVIGSENIAAGQISAIGTIADKIVGTYGLSEGAGFALRCPHCSAYSELGNLGLISLRPRPDGLCDIIGTAFWALDTLFIAYATGDIASGRAEACGTCPPAPLRFGAVEGRSKDVLLDRRGNPYLLGLILGAKPVVEKLRNVRLFDCVQRQPGEVTFRYVSSDGLLIDEEALLRALREACAGDISFRIRLEPRLLALRSGAWGQKKWSLLKVEDI